MGQILDRFDKSIEFTQSHRPEEETPILTTSVNKVLMFYAWTTFRTVESVPYFISRGIVNGVVILRSDFKLSILRRWRSVAMRELVLEVKCFGVKVVLAGQRFFKVFQNRCKHSFERINYGDSVFDLLTS